MPEVVVVILLDAADADALLARPAIAKLVDKGRLARLDPTKGDVLQIDGDGYVASVTTSTKPTS